MMSVLKGGMDGLIKGHEVPDDQVAAKILLLGQSLVGFLLGCNKIYPKQIV